DRAARVRGRARVCRGRVRWFGRQRECEQRRHPARTARAQLDTERGPPRCVEAPVGITTAQGLLPAHEQGIPIVAIGTILPVNDSSLMSLPKDGITQPKDL